MSAKLLLLVLTVCLSICTLGRADFKYTQTSQITGGAMAGMMKGLGVFSKSMRQATKPMESTTYVKGNHLRTDNADGTYEIIDLDGRRFIQVDPNHQTYSVMTFEQMREAMQNAQQRMNEEMNKQSKNQGQQNGQNAQVTMTPKIQITPTGKTQSILGQDTQEMVMKMDLQMQATDAQHGTQSGTISTEMDEWMAPSVMGYHEVGDFYKKMATEIGWTPNTAFGMDPRMTKSMVELNKSGKIPVGLPMLSVMSMLGAAPQGDQAAPQQQQNQQQSSSGIGDVTNPGAAAAKALGGMFGRHKKKQQEEDNQNASAPQATTPSNSLMSITSRVTSFSTDSLEDALFQIPSGFNQVQSNMDRALQGKTH
ncbi:MAG: hypothetical protein ACRD2P_02435 [Terriglobia bacterium]